MGLNVWDGSAWVPAISNAATGYGKMTLLSDFTVPDNNATQVTWGAFESYGDPSADAGKTYITVSVQGLYEVYASAQMRPPASTGRSRIVIERVRSGVTTDICAAGMANAALDVIGPGMNVSDVVPLLAADRVQLRVFQTSTAATSTVLAATAVSTLTVVRVGNYVP